MYIINRTGYNSFKLELTFDISMVSCEYKVNKLNTITNVEDNVLLPLYNDSFCEYSSDDYIKVETTDNVSIPVSLSNDSVYYVYVKHNNVEYKHVLINIKAITDYLFETAQDNICCCPSKPCNENIFRNRDYVFNVVSNMAFSFLGWEFRDINVEYDDIPGTLKGRIQEVNEIIFRINEYLLNTNFEYSC